MIKLEHCVHICVIAISDEHTLETELNSQPLKLQNKSIADHTNIDCL